MSMPVVEARVKFSTPATFWYSLCSVISTTKATRNYSYLDQSYLEGWLFYHGINPRDVARGHNSFICKFFSSYQEQQHIRKHLFLEHCKWV